MERQITISSSVSPQGKKNLRQSNTEFLSIHCNFEVALWIFLPNRRPVLNNPGESRDGGKAICLGSPLQESSLDAVYGLPEDSVEFSVWMSCPQPAGGRVKWCVLCMSFHPSERHSLFPTLVSEQALKLNSINASETVAVFRPQLRFKDLFYF